MRRRYDGISRLLLSAEHLQNLLRGSGPRVGLVRVRLLLLVRYICAGRVGLSRLGLIVGIVLAATQGVARRGLWISAGVAAGVLGACAVAALHGGMTGPATES